MAIWDDVKSIFRGNWESRQGASGGRREEAVIEREGNLHPHADAPGVERDHPRRHHQR